MKYFCCSDIHGAYDIFMQTIKQNEYNCKNSNHQLIVCGDCFGRGQKNEMDSVKIYKYLTSTEHTNKPIVIYGNHEDILYKMLRRGNVTHTDMVNGEHLTLASFANVDLTEVIYNARGVINTMQMREELQDWLEHLPRYYETKTHIFVHGFLPYNFLAGQKIEWIQEEEWCEAAWVNTEEEILFFLRRYPNGLVNKTVVFGHWYTFKLYTIFNRANDPIFDIWTHKNAKLIGLDGCTIVSNKINMYIFEE